MHNWWGMVIGVIGLFMALGGLSKSDFILYRILAARSRVFWGDKVHAFYIATGFMVTVFGALVAFGFIRR